MKYQSYARSRKPRHRCPFCNKLLSVDIIGRFKEHGIGHRCPGSDSRISTKRETREQ